jgi:hypothetical protein
MTRQAATCGQALALLAQIGETHHGLGQVVFGGQLQRVHARAGQRLAQLGFALGRDAREALAEAGVVGVHQQLFPGLGIAQGEEAQIRHFQLQRIEQSHGHDFVPQGQLGQGFSQPGSLMKSDTTNSVERRRTVLAAA